MALPTLLNKPTLSLHSNFLPPIPINRIKNSLVYKTLDLDNINGVRKNVRPKSNKISTISITCSTSSPIKSRRDPSLDKHVVKNNKIRFVQKLTTLLLSKPKHFMPLHILSKCRSYLSLSEPVSVLSMIHRYPAIFELFNIPRPPTPLNATKPPTQLCVRLTRSAEALAVKEISLKKAMSDSLALKLQKLLMMASHHRLLLSKLVHLGPDLGLPVNFRSRLCNDYPDTFKVIDTSYGRALELVRWDSDLAHVTPSRAGENLDLIVDRPLKFKQLRLRKGLNVKRKHQEYLIKFNEMQDVCPYKTKVGELSKESIEAEKRACAVVREVLGMTVEKRTLVDHLTHFRKEFGLPNKLRAMLVRHPDLFYVSLKGQRDSVFLVEGYDDKGVLLEKDEEIVEIKMQLMELVREGKRMRREHRKDYIKGDEIKSDVSESDDEDDDCVYDYHDDGLDELFKSEDFGSDDDGTNDDEVSDVLQMEETGEFWTTKAVSSPENENDGGSGPW